MWRGRWVRAVVAFGLTGALMGVVPSGAALPAYARCRPTAFVADGLNGSVSTIDVKTRTKKPADITVGSAPFGIALTPDGKTAFVTNRDGGTMSTIGVKTRAKNPNDIAVGPNPSGVAVTPDGRTAFVAHGADVLGPIVPGSNTVSTIDVKTRTKNPNDITVGMRAFSVKVTPDGRTAFVTNYASGTVSTIDVATRTKNPDDITVGANPVAVAFTPDGQTAFVTNQFSNTVSTIDVKTRTKNPNDIGVSALTLGVAITPCRQ